MRVSVVRASAVFGLAVMVACANDGAVRPDATADADPAGDATADAGDGDTDAPSDAPDDAPEVDVGDPTDAPGDAQGDGSGDTGPTEDPGPLGEDGLALVRMRAASAAPVSIRADRGIPAFMAFDLPAPETEDDIVDGALAFLERWADLYRIPEPTRTLIPDRVDLDEESGIASVRFAQHVRGVRVFGSALRVTMSGGRALGSSGTWVPDLTPSLGDATPAVPTAGLGGSRARHIGPPELVWADDAVTPGVGAMRLAWRVRLQRGGEVSLALFDARTGELLWQRVDELEDEYRNVCPNPTADPIEACIDADSWFVDSVQQPGYSAAVDPAGDGLAVEQGLDDCEYLLGLLNRETWDGTSGGLSAQVGMAFVDGAGAPAPNAKAWDWARSIGFSPGWTVRDVVGHEYGHMVVSGMGGLDYVGESGALNESLADFFGNLSEWEAWRSGDIPGPFSWNVDATAASVLRDMADPPRLGQPDHVKASISGDDVGLRDVTQPDDNGFVHTNSGIPNKVLYLLADGGEHNYLRVDRLGEIETLRLAFFALRDRLTPQATFLDMREAMVAQVQAWNALGTSVHSHTWTGADICSVQAAWASVGVGSYPSFSDCDSWTGDEDPDGDGIPNLLDTCPDFPSVDNSDTDLDRVGNACDDDDDNDGVEDSADNCPLHPNPGQTDSDGDGSGNACDPNDDHDALLDVDDNCPTVDNPGQEDNDGDGTGDACDNDDDDDGVADPFDLCPNDADPDQTDSDGDGVGDACDSDDDNDGRPDSADNCRVTPNPTQTDTDADGVGDACDNCLLTPNPDQTDADHDGKGRACEGPVMDDPITQGQWPALERVLIDAEPDGWVELPASCPACPVTAGRDWITRQEAAVRVSLPDGARVEFWTATGRFLGAVDEVAGVVSFGIEPSFGFTAPGARAATAVDAILAKVSGVEGTLSLGLSWER